jgi:hypothetical protein
MITNSVQGFLLFHMLYFHFLILANWTCMRWHLIVVLACISPMISDAEYFFIYFLVIYKFSFEKYLFRSVAYFKIGLFIFLPFSCLPSCVSQAAACQLLLGMWNKNKKINWLILWWKCCCCVVKYQRFLISVKKQTFPKSHRPQVTYVWPKMFGVYPDSCFCLCSLASVCDWGSHLAQKVSENLSINCATDVFPCCFSFIQNGSSLLGSSDAPQIRPSWFLIVCASIPLFLLVSCRKYY